MSKRNSIERYKEDKKIISSKSKVKFENFNEIKISETIPPLKNLVVSMFLSLYLTKLVKKWIKNKMANKFIIESIRPIQVTAKLKNYNKREKFWIINKLFKWGKFCLIKWSF